MDQVNPRVDKEVTNVRDFIWMNLFELHGSKVEDDPQEWEDSWMILKMYKMLMIIGVTSIENNVLDTYQLNGVSYVWFNQ